MLLLILNYWNSKAKPACHFHVSFSCVIFLFSYIMSIKEQQQNFLLVFN